MRQVLALIAICLLATAAQVNAKRDPSEPAAGAGDKMICKRFVKIGTLAGGYRTCKTKKEWERERENARQFSVSDSCSMRGERSDLCAQ